MQQRSGSWQTTVVQGVDFLTKAVVVGVPTLYLLGWSYLESFWKVFGLDDVAMGFVTVEYLRAGSFGLISNFMWAMGYLGLLAVASVVLIVLLVILREGALDWLVRRARAASRFRDRVAGKRLHMDEEQAEIAALLDRGVDAVGNASMTVLMTALIALVFLLVTAVSGSSLGKARGAAWMDKISAAGLGANIFTFVPKVAGTEGGAILVGCSAANCAVYNGRYISVVARTAIPVMIPCRTVRADRQGGLYCAKQSLRN